MNRRKFVATSTVIGVGGLPILEKFTEENKAEAGNELYEVRKYEVAFGGNRNQLITYFREVWFPALNESGANHTFLFKELGDADPAQIWTVVAYPDFQAYQACQGLNTNDVFLKSSRTYIDAGKLYNRYTSFLLTAFDGMPQLSAPGEDKELFELRIYEGMNEDAVRRKVMMFDDEEITLFKKVGLDAVFFGNMIVGPYMPCLVYLLAFSDMEARSAAWSKFVAHPDWQRMKDLPKYANTLSNIQKIFLQPI